MSEVEAQAPRIADPTITARPATDPTPSNDRDRGQSGVVPIKAEFLLPITAPSNRQDDSNADDDAEASTSHAGGDSRDTKRRKTGGPGDKKKNRGQNKNRDLRSIQESGPKMCRQWELTGICERGEEACKFSHDWKEYFASKPRDLPLIKGFKVENPFVIFGHEGEEAGEDTSDEIGRAIDLGTSCPVYKDLGYCPYGWRCRFLGGHVKKAEGGEGKKVGDWVLTSELTKEEEEGWRNGETNWPDFKMLIALRKCRYDYPFTRKYLELVEPSKPFTLTRTPKSQMSKKPAPTLSEQSDITSKDAMYDEEAAMNAESEALAAEEDAMNAMNAGVIDGQAEAIDVPLRPEEKRRLNWEDGLYLAPLTTVGNLPFRRLCTDLGATITVSEMALAQPLISGQDNEWALCRRHSSEKIFGIQLAGSYPNRMVPAAELIAKELGASDKSGKGVDFVDVNLGCPIDLVFNQGAGSALLDVPGRLGKILIGMNRALGEIPLTVKFRTGVATGKPNAHKLIPRFATEWGISALTLHGRSRQQRYSKLADWNYIRQCTNGLRAALSDAGLPPVPMFGNGDCFSSQQYYEEKEKSGVDGVMIARGALIKPWIFTEVKERREWDISATERLEIVKKYAEYGLSHWGSDHMGIQKTRRFLCEFLSFTHRYVPIGLLERMPPQMNERPPKFKGRNELETLLASDDSRDWVKISDMFLGKTEEEWGWVPKHKSNAYGGEEAQG